ncbi:adhesion G protein-coupled receptor A2-like [Babylonia areolata]|uniref:adhesion G protein-coupled receptor A2-like n=1 Tax=Babylonia areolata TaxID=304850 RepID=UPI003FD307F0
MKSRRIHVLPQGKYWWLLFLVLMMILVVVVDSCVPSCQCTMVGTKKKQKGRRVECSKHPAPFTSLAHINFPPDTVQLDLTQNQLTVLKDGSFIQLSMLRKLNLSSNQISIIEPGAFEGLQNLRHLDLSFNKIGTINSSMFTGLPKLEKLWLNNNHINTIPDGTFNDLTSLRRIDFGSDYLRCDCHLRWVVQWAESKKVRLARETVCALPSPMQGRMLRKLTADQLHCEHDLQLPVFEIKPSHSQLVFEGDKLPFECRASVIHPRTSIAWVREGQEEVEMSTNKTAGVFVHTSYSPDRTIVSHSLVVENLDKSHEGIWSCQVTTPQGKVTKHVEVEVLNYIGLSCPPITRTTPKGRYVFDEMLAGVKAKQPCQVGGPGRYVTYLCDHHATWRNLNTSACAFTSDLTRSLEKLAREDLNGTDIDRYIQRLQQVSMTSKHRRLISDIMLTDVHYLTSILQNRLLPLAFTSQHVSKNVLWLTSNLTALPAPLLSKAQVDSRSTKRVLDVLQNLTTNIEADPGVQDWSQSSRNIALIVLREVELRASRVHCSLRRSRRQGQSWLSGRQLTCSRLGNSSENRHLWSENTDVSVDLPATLLQDAGVLDENDTSVFITVFRNGRLFPTTATQHADPKLAHGNWTVATSVVSVSVGHPVPNLTQPVVLVLRTGNRHRPISAAYWDFTANDGLGDWRTDGCEIIERKGNHTLVHAYHLSYFAIIEDVSEKPSVVVMEPVIYVGSCICILCMLVVFITYVSSFRVILCPKKLKHSVINLCLAVMLMLLGFVVGINRTDMAVPCQVTGICLHYFTLAATFWITITANNMYKKFTKADQPPSPPPEPVSMPLPPKPILRFYFLGWGVPIIICGITAAVNLNHYLGLEYCFLAWEPSLGAFYAPMGLLIILNLIFFMRISCVVHTQSAAVLNDSDETEEVHTNEIELVPSQADTNLEVQSVTQHDLDSHRRSRNVSINGSGGVRRSGVGGGSIRTGGDDDDDDDSRSTVSLPDAERRPITQLRALVATLFLYIVMWVCGALAIARPFHAIIPYQELIFSYLYGLVSAVFGIFMVSYFCFTRNDASVRWKSWFGFGPPATYSGPVAATEQPAQTSEPSTPTAQPNGTVVKSNSNMDVSVYSQKSSNITKACNMKNNVNKQTNNSNINLVSLPASSLTEVSVTSAQENVPNFYNPRQNGAARKFWQKNRQQKVMNKDVNKDINASLTDNLSGTENGHQMSQGTGSEANTHLSIEIQIQPKDRGSGKNLSGGGYDNTSSSSNLNRQNHVQAPSSAGGPLPSYSPHMNNTTTAALISAHAHSPLGYKSDGGVYGRHCPSPSRSHVSPAGSQHCVTSQHATPPQQPQLPHHQRTASSCSLGAHPSAFTPVQPRNNNTLPRQGKPDSTPPPPTSTTTTNMLSNPPSEGGVYPAETCGVFVDGPAGVPPGPMVQGAGQYMGPQAPSPFTGYEPCMHTNYLPPQMCNIPVSHAYPHFGPSHHALARSISPVVSGIQGVMYYPHPHPLHSPAHSHHGPPQPISGDSSDASSRHRRHSRYSNNSNNLHRTTSGAGNNNNSNGGVGVGAGLGGGGGGGSGSKSPVVSDITATPSSHDGRIGPQDSDSQSQAKKARSIDSDHHSDPTHRKKHRTRDKYGRRHGQGGMTKQRSLGWEEQFKNRPAKVAYAYVNHNYRDKVMTKLIKQASESDELAKKAFWLPRSLSEYDRLTQMGFCNLVEDTSSSSEEDSFDNVWLPQTNNNLDLFKKETSV